MNRSTKNPRRVLPIVMALVGVGAMTGVTCAELLGIRPEFPLMAFNNLGRTTYKALTNEYDVDAEPLSIRFTPETPPRPVFPTGPDAERSLELHILVDNDGNLIGGVPGPDLVIVGEVDADGDGTIDFDGTLLTGEVLAFGFRDGPGGAGQGVEGVVEEGIQVIDGMMEMVREEGGPGTTLTFPFGGGTDEFDFRFRLTGGSMAGLYAARDIGLGNTSEMSTFENFLDDFTGGAKGTVGPVPSLGACCMSDGSCMDGLTQAECEEGGGFFGGRESICDLTECPGACCLPDETCEFLTRTECLEADGDFRGEGVLCDNVTCVRDRGACCFDDGTCEIRTQDECRDQGGSYQGTGSICIPGLCPQPDGACCFEDGFCFAFSQEECEAQGGEFLGDGTQCEPETCTPSNGACCFPDGTCGIETEDDCIDSGGIFQGGGTVCDPELCPDAEGACCFEDGACEIFTQAECTDAGGMYQGNESICEPGLCSLPDGACCLDDGTCQSTTLEECENLMGLFQGFGTVCEPGLCTPAGACCFDDGTCSIVERDECEGQGGLYQGDNSQCDPELCPETKGACCLDGGTCAVTLEDDCVAAGGDYQGDETICAPGLCAVDGACCLDDGSCVIATQGDCAEQGGLYQGDNTACIPGLCPGVGACCFDDGDCVDGLTQAQCSDDGGTFQGEGSMCSDVDCGRGACCFDNGDCVDGLTEAQCMVEGGEFQGDGSMCVDVVCGRGACCFDDGSCTDDVTEAGCTALGGRYQGDASLCADVVCGRGACCFDDGSCAVLSASACDEEGGRYEGDGSDCDTAECEDGACCLPDLDCSTGNFECDGKVVFMTMIWDGDEPVRIKAYDGDTDDPLLAEIDDIQIGDEVTIGPLAGPNDSYWEVFEAGTDNLIGLSKFHRSCSDDEMDGPEDCGNREGNGKGNDDGFINDWILEGLVDEANNSFDCGQSGGGGENCIVLSAAECAAQGGTFQGSGVSCEDADCTEPTGACCLNDNNDCVVLTQFCCESAGGLYAGDGTNCVDNPCFDCDGKIVQMTMIWDGDQPVRIKAWDGDVGSDQLADIDDIQIGDEVTVGPLAGPNDSYWEIFEAGTDTLIGESKFHRSCSDNEMNGPEDCGNRQGNGKGNDDGFINDWILEGLVDENGGVLDCTANLLRDDAGGESEVEIGSPDVNADGVVDLRDLLEVLGSWGSCAACPQDVNGDLSVDFADLLYVLGNLR